MLQILIYTGFEYPTVKDEIQLYAITMNDLNIPRLKIKSNDMPQPWRKTHMNIEVIIF